MPKLPLILAGVGVVAVVGVGAIVLNQKNTPANKDANSTVSSENSTKLVDPNGDYAFFNDPSVTKYPEKNATFGNGQTLTFEYDGTKTNNDEYATLSYQLYYIQNDGKVQPMGGGNVEGKGRGTFTLSNKVFNSSAKNRSGFLELLGTYTTGTSGTSVKLGMYPITFDISE